MKKYFILIIISLVSFSVFSQRPVRDNYSRSQDNAVLYDFPRNEIRANLLMSVMGYPTIDYEYFVEDNFGVGLSGAISLLTENGSEYRGMLSPYGRLYFGSMATEGFFIEGSVSSVFYNRSIYNNNEVSSTKKITPEFGLGVAVGYKILTRNNWVGELLLGAGRTFKESYDVYPRLGISIGKRF